ncbi:MAG: hypothetical protein A3J62_03680 [Candidatus Buchananbacteria bacterium RIFCSPHIGHO2_02_FULL_38_8]|uniref:Glycosyl transferase family 1 domain-containing protein n=3 Tax=Candidatus Buchananiibacteriota TaxID=1817903 RepID=A0A1G1Y4S4_9BACT|nr:MAG: hypothetical protein A3J62_03680 [Candidatus Buchananbacteria bacterium RIFCSPHIGHO2_02_FULL_38_8]
MRVLIFSLAYSPFIGGAELAVKNITERISDTNFDMVTVNLDGRQAKKETIGNVNVYRVGKGKVSKYLFPLSGFKKAAELHQKNNYDIIWAIMANQAGLAALKFKKNFPKVKYILTLQEGDSLKSIWLRTWFIRPWYKAIYKKADRIQAISNFLKERAVKYGYLGPIDIVSNGVDFKQFSQEFSIEELQSLRSHIGLEPKDKVIVSVSRLVKKNGLDTLIKSIKDLAVKLLILGAGQQENKLKALARELGLEMKVLFLGYVDHKDLPKYLRIADVFVRPSRSEGLGSAFLEAMAADLPVVATPVGGIPDFLAEGETGLFCEVGNSRNLQEKISQLLFNQDLRNKIIIGGRELVLNKYSWENISREMAEIFKSSQEEINFKKGKLISGIIYPEIFPLTKKDSVLNIGCGDGVQAVVYQGHFKKMIGVDINQERLNIANKLSDFYSLDNFETLKANVENIPLDEKFDKAIAVDIIEHVVNPDKLIQEASRLVKERGQLLITFPAMHDRWENLFRFVGRKILRRKGKTVYLPAQAGKDGWDPDAHQHSYKLKKWIKIVESGGFKLIKSRASTLFPPLHYLGLPRFWFSNHLIHLFDRFFCSLPIIKNFGQALVCVFEKNEQS